MKSTKNFIAVMLVSMFVIGMTGCGSKQANTNDNKDVKKEKVEIRFMDMSPRPEREKFYNDMIAGYQKEYSNVTVAYESVPYEQALNKITTLGAAKDLPDIVNLHENWKYTLVQSGWLVKLDERLAKNNYKDTFVKPVTDIQWNQEIKRLGGIYTMPDGIMTNGIFVRKDWIKEAGLDFNQLMNNWTWETYMDTVAKLTDKSKNRYGISYRGGQGGLDRITQYLIGYSGGRTFDEEGNCLLYSPENVKRLDKFLDMYRLGYGPKDSINWGFAEMVDNFTGGLTATLNNDVEVVATAKERMKDDQWGVLPLPRSSVDGNIYSYVGAVYVYSISSFSEHQDEAWNFIEYISRPENNAEYCKILTMLPVRKEVKDPFFGENGPVAGFMKQINDPKFAVSPDYGPVDVADIRNTYHGEFQKVLQGKETTDKVLKQLNDELTTRAKKWLKDNPGKSLGDVLKIN